MAWHFYWAGSYSQQPKYYQYQYGGCLVGCGAVAWTILFCWADYQAAHGNSYWASRSGLYPGTAPLAMDQGVKNVIQEIRGYIGTFCSGNSGATLPWSMGNAYQYFAGRTGTTLEAHCNPFGFTEGSLMYNVRASIVARDTPAVIGTGWLTHYPVAYGYAYRKRIVRHCFVFCWDQVVVDRSFKVNQGWGQSSGEWVPSDTWFSGEIYP